MLETERISGRVLKGISIVFDKQERLARSLTYSLALALALFIASGYIWSDDLFFSRVIADNGISTPEQAFLFVRNSVQPIARNLKPIRGLTPRYLLTQRKTLYCDEQAVLLATLVRKLGNDTRLVNLMMSGGLSHSVLEVYQNGAWKGYDPRYGLEGFSYEQIVKLRALEGVYEEGAKFQAIRVKYSKFPRLYNWLIQHNYYLKHIALFLRGIPG